MNNCDMEIEIWKKYILARLNIASGELAAVSQAIMDGPTLCGGADSLFVGQIIAGDVRELRTDVARLRNEIDHLKVDHAKQARPCANEVTKLSLRELCAEAELSDFVFEQQ